MGKRYVQKKEANIKLRMIIFVIGFVACIVIGGIMRGPLEAITKLGAEGNISGQGSMFTRIVALAYEKTAFVLGMAVGLPIASDAGRIFTLISSLFFLVMSVSMYTANSGTEIADFGDAPETGISRAIHFAASFGCLSSVAFIMMDVKYLGMVRSNRGYNAVMLLFFVIAAIASIFNYSDDEAPVKHKVMARWLSSIGFTLGAAGLGRVIFDSGLMDKLHGPTLAWSALSTLTDKLTPDWSGLIGIALIIGVPAFVAYLCGACMLNSKNCNIPVSMAVFAVYVMGALFFYSNRGTNGMELRSVAVWVLLLAAAFVWAIVAERRRILVLISSLILPFAVSFVKVGFSFSRPTFDAAIEALRPEMAPLQEKATAFVLQYIPNEFAAMILLLIAALLISFLLSLPVRFSKKLPGAFRMVLEREQLLFGAGVVLCFMETVNTIFRTAAYIILLLSAVSFFILFFLSIVARKPRCTLAVLYIAACTALVAIPFALFAVQFAWIVFALFTALNFFLNVKAAMEGGGDSEDKKKQQAQAAYGAASDALHSAAMAGGDSYSLSMAQGVLNSAFGMSRSIFD